MRGQWRAELERGPVALLGFGQENRALARFLAGQGVPFWVCDARAPEDRAERDAELQPWLRGWRLGAEYLEGLERYGVAFRTPGLRPDHPALARARAAGVRLWSQTRLFAALSPAPLVGITGTKGKGTTASLLGAMLQADGRRRVWLGGNIGAPPIAWLGELRAADLAVLELSSFQLADWDARLTGAVLLRIAADHLDYHGTRAAYVAAKARLVAAQQPEDWLVVDDDCPTASAIASQTLATVLRVSVAREVQTGAWVQDDWLWVRRPGDRAERVGAAADIPLRGRHNWSNVLAAVAAARMLGVAAPAIRAAIAGFRGLPHRLAHVASHAGVAYYDDSLATTPEAAAAAVAAFAEPVVLIAGGASKQADFAPLARAVCAGKVRAVVLIGAEAPRLAAALRAAGWDAARILDGGRSMASAVAAARSQAQPGDVVLLAPACASFDMFRDYRARGEAFAAAVAALA